MLSKLFTAVVAACAVLGTNATPLETRQSAGKPSVDPFYKPPTGWQNAAPGAILRSREAAKLGSLKYSKAYQLLYRTTDSLGNPTSTVTTVIIPQNPSYDKLLSYQIFYDSANVDCSPSYTLTQNGLNNIDNGVADGLAQGWVVSTSDYEGPLAAFTAGVISGQATLDAIRATLASTAITGVNSNARTALWGYSGGALASEWAAELAPTYAPELSFAGVALGGLTPNVRTVAYTINKGFFSGLLPSGVLGLASQYPDAAAALNEVLLPQYAAQFRAAGKRCLADQTLFGAYQDYSKYFKGGLAAIDLPASQRAIQAGGIMGLHGTPVGPLYVYKGVKDQVSPVGDTDDLVRKYCSAGTKIQYVREANQDHLGEMGAGKDGAISFLKTVFARGLVFGNCGSNGIPN